MCSVPRPHLKSRVLSRVSRQIEYRRLDTVILYARWRAVCDSLTPVHIQISYSEIISTGVVVQWAYDMFSEESRFRFKTHCCRITIWSGRGTRIQPGNVMKREKRINCFPLSC